MATCPFSTRRRDRIFNDCSWELPNSTVIYYNYTNPLQQNCNCVCPFGGDSDVAGPGVITGFVVTAWITCFFAVIDVYCRFSHSFIHKISKEGEENVEELFQKQLDRFKHCHPSIQCLVNLCHIPKAAAIILSLLRRKNSRLRYTAKASLDILCDIQVVTSTAICIAGFIQIQTMTFYHQQFVLEYCWLTLNSFWAGRTGQVDQSKGKTDWYYWTRTVAIFISVTLFSVFQAIVIPRQADQGDWNPVESGKCYISHDESAYNQQYMWMAGSFFYAVYLLLENLSGLVGFIAGRPGDGSQTWMEEYSMRIRRKDMRLQERYKTWVFWLLKRTDVQQEFCLENYDEEPCQQIITHHFPKGVYYPLKAFSYSPLGIWWAGHQFLALWSWGDADSTLLVAAYLGFAAWDTFDIIDTKISNTHLVEDEASWGFGQALPVVLLLLILLNIFDAIDKSSKHKEQQK